MSEGQSEAQKRKYIELTTGDPHRLVTKYAVPSIVTMIISAVYNMADSFYVGRIDTQSTAALGVVFSYMTLIQAVAFFFGQGSGNYISRALGRRDVKKASEMASVGLISAMITGCLIAAVCAVFATPLLKFLGSTDSILDYALGYFYWILPGTPFIIGCFALNNQMRQQGNAMMSMIGIAAGAILNILIDPLFIFTFGLGVRGAGIATFISQAAGFLLLLALSGRNGGLSIKLSDFKPSVYMYREISAGGLPSLARQGFGTVATICLNNVASTYGDTAIAAFSIVNRVVMFTGAAMIGYGQGFQPVCGFNYGAGKYDRVRRAFRGSVIVGTIYCIAAAILGFVFAPHIIRLFRAEDAEVVRMGTEILRWQCVSFPLIAFIVITNMFLQNIRRTVPAVVLSASRQGAFLIPVLLAGNALFGFTGVETSQCVADVLAFILALPLCLSALKSMKRRQIQ